MPCFETCKTCKYGGDSQINNCTSCAFGYTFIPGLINTTNCITKCPYFHYYTTYVQYKCSEVSVCPKDYYLLIREKNKCIDNCTKDDEYKYQYNGECYKQCPSDSKDNDDYICKDNNINICSLSQRTISVASQTITEQEKENLAKSYVKEFSYTDNHISFFNYGNSEIIFYKNYERMSDLGLEIPKVDLGDCYRKIQEKYLIEENLIIGVKGQRTIDVKYPIISSFSVYSPYNGIKLDLKICENEAINVQEDLSMKIDNKKQYLYLQQLTKQNVDVFNLSSEFYQDICFYFESPIEKDIAIKDRVKLFFPNITLCENGCKIKGINSTTMKAECECKLDNLINNNALANNAFYKSQVGDIEEILNHINIEILKCSNKIFKNRKISSYKGSFIILVFIFIQVILTLFYCIVDITSLKKIYNKYFKFILKSFPQGL